MVTVLCTCTHPGLGLFVAAKITEPVVNIVKVPPVILHVSDMGRLVTHWRQTHTYMPVIHLVCIMHTICDKQRPLAIDVRMAIMH